MNIFYLHPDPVVAAQLHCDKHVVKMILESAQILCAVHDRHGSWQGFMYKPAYVKHPSVLWAGDSAPNYVWLWHLSMALCAEYTARYGKVHTTQALLVKLETPPPMLADNGVSEPPQCMPDECKADSAIDAYRTYYKHKRTVISMKWNRTDNAPTFMEIL